MLNLQKEYAVWNPISNLSTFDLNKQKHFESIKKKNYFILYS